AATAAPEEYRRVAAGGQKTPEAKQVPELKTIFYEFVPINAYEKLPESATAANGGAAQTSGAGEGGSDLTGSLGAMPTTDSATAGYGGAASLAAPVYDPVSGRVLSAPQPVFARKFGLSRRELDYETPTGDESASDANSSLDAMTVSEDLEAGVLGSALGGSLTAPPPTSGSTLASAAPGADAALDPTAAAGASHLMFQQPLTAAQIAMDSDDGATWAPEVVDCRFKYFDGDAWLDSWDSIEKQGLPIAIKAELKIVPLDDVDIYRYSELLAYLPQAPTPEEIANYRDPDETENVAMDGAEYASDVAGSLASPLSTEALTEAAKRAAASGVKIGVDVFNSYRPIPMIRLAQLAPALVSNDPFTAYSSQSKNAGTQTAAVGEGAAETNASVSLLSGGLGGGLGVESEDPNGALGGGE
ncbi:MAG: hypothetical protein HUK22_07680, partial [Thermoguttaceae bacterium]|nr:hypothetical protein [Thermoguttaceae bacterium]